MHLYSGKNMPKRLQKKAWLLCFVCVGICIWTAMGIYRQKPTIQERQNIELGILFKNEEDVVQTIRDSLRKHDWRIMIQFTSDGEYMEDISALVNMLMQQVFVPTEQPKEGDYLRYQYGGYNLSYGHESFNDQYNYVLYIEPIYYTTLEQEEQTDAIVTSILKELNFKYNTSDYEKARAIYEYLYDTVEYDQVHKNNEYYHLNATAYGALVNHTAGCQGYSVAMYRLLKEAGVNSRILTGTVKWEGNTEFHAWNIVEIEEKYYNIDVTWDKQLGTNTYFLLSDSSFTDHIRDSEFNTEKFREIYIMSENDFLQ